jgi:F-type H+-transporting ATPase subunit gamma
VAANLKQIRKRIASVKSTQKITRAMKLVSGARLNKAQQRILALRPYAIKVQQVLAETTQEPEPAETSGEPSVAATDADEQPLLVRRPRKNLLLLVLTSDRGLCGAFNTNIGKAALRAWREGEAAGQKVQMAVIGRKGRDFLRRREAPVVQVFSNIWDRVGLEATREVAHALLKPFLAGEVDAIQLVYNEFKSAMSQRVVVEGLLPVPRTLSSLSEEEAEAAHLGPARDFIFEPNRTRLLARLVPMYLEVTLLRALYESQASELGARMTAMDAATKNAKEMIDKLTLLYNRARQAAITTELMEIIGGANALAG